jgi:phosphoglycolate phosphatase
VFVTEEYDAVVYDLDGTLVDLDVDWDAVRTDAASAVRARGVDPEAGNLWEILERAEDAGYRRLVEELIADYERDGARTATRLALADELPLGVPTAVCSLNAEAACRIALELYGLDSHVDAIVGRDTVSGVKPDPEPLLAAVEALDADPSRTLFVGDTETDERTAKRAGLDFQYTVGRV